MKTTSAHERGERESDERVSYRFSKLPNPTLQNPKVHTANTVPKMIAPPGPFVGRFRLYLIGLNPPDGGKSLHYSTRSSE